MRQSRRYAVRLMCGALLAASIAVAWNALGTRPIDEADGLAAEPTKSKVEPQVLFTKWPQDQKPELVLVLSGQTYGYLQKCGCSSPQKGGLERRYNFIESLKARGWEVMGLDIGDVPRPLPYTPSAEQTRTKYEVAMQAMKLMGYKAVGVGREELALPLLDGLQKYSLQSGNEYPRVLAANISNRGDFPDAKGGSTLYEDEVLETKSGLRVGVTSVAGAELIRQGVDRAVTYNVQTGAVVAGVLKKWDDSAKPPEVRVLLYQGPFDWKDPGTGKQADAQSAAKAFPKFQIVVCKTQDDSDGPDLPTTVNDGKTHILRVGQKGQNLGVLGIFKGKGGDYEFHYQRVVMAEEFETPAAQAKANPVLKLLQDYADTVKDNDYLSAMAARKKAHPLQLIEKNATFVGDTMCFSCHQAEFGVWQKSKHSHAYDALALTAKNPAGRNFDGECIICHTVGYEYKTGYLNERTTKHLKNVQCESCHGPASLHVAEEAGNAKKRASQQTHKHALQLSPWKQGGKGNLPSADKLTALAKRDDGDTQKAGFTELEHKVYQGVYQACTRCHDLDNDPKFKLESYWPNIAHSGMKKK